MGDKTSLEDRINSNSTHGSYADTYSSLATVQSTHKPTYKLIKWCAIFLQSDIDFNNQFFRVVKIGFSNN